jgi:hypothetical protein
MSIQLPYTSVERRYFINKEIGAIRRQVNVFQTLEVRGAR